MTRRCRWLAALALLPSVLFACDDDDGTGTAELDLAVCSPSNGPFRTEVDNAYFPLPVGRRLVLFGAEAGVRLRVELAVLPDTALVAGVRVRLVEEARYVDDALVRVSRHFYAQAPDGTVCAFGEDVDDYEGGEIVGHGGAWRAGEADARAGIAMPAAPEPGMRFAQEAAPGVAEDMSEVQARGRRMATPAGEFKDALFVVGWNPLEGQTPSEGVERVYAPGVGLVRDGPLELIQME